MYFKEKIYPYLLTTIQLSSLVYLLISAPAIARDYGGILIESAGIFLGLLAIFQMGIGNFNIIPQIKKDGILVTTGIYSVIRHPMYLAQLVAVLPLIIDYFSYFRLAVWFILLVDLLIKIQYEEKRLLAHFEGYAKYKMNSKKLIPFIY